MDGVAGGGTGSAGLLSCWIAGGSDTDGAVGETGGAGLQGCWIASGSDTDGAAYETGGEGLLDCLIAGGSDTDGAAGETRGEGLLGCLTAGGNGTDGVVGETGSAGLGCWVAGGCDMGGVVSGTGSAGLSLSWTRDTGGLVAGLLSMATSSSISTSGLANLSMLATEISESGETNALVGSVFMSVGSFCPAKAREGSLSAQTSDLGEI